MMKCSTLFFLFSALIVAVNCVSLEELIGTEWQAFKVKHNKTYSSTQEDRFRFKVFLENRAKIARHNRDATNSALNYRLSMNKYGDLLHHEFLKLNGYAIKNNRIENGSTYLSPANVKPPLSIDWREHGLVTPVKDQGQCGSCWAFSTTGSLEGQIKRKTGKLISLSEQNLVDCSTKFGNNGCNGGMMDNAFTYIKKNHGVDTEKSYPYLAKDGKCHFTKSHIGGTDTGFVDILSGDEEKLKEAIGTVGPVSVAIDASHQSFQFYSDGVYDEPTCSSTDLDHGVLAVGYGTTEEGQDYWLIKNSWGTTWGDNGYIKIARNKDNLCGVATQASYPLV